MPCSTNEARYRERLPYSYCTMRFELTRTLVAASSGGNAYSACGFLNSCACSNAQTSVTYQNTPPGLTHTHHNTIQHKLHPTPHCTSADQQSLTNPLEYSNTATAFVVPLGEHCSWQPWLWYSSTVVQCWSAPPSASHCAGGANSHHGYNPKLQP